ncbi:MAG: carbon-nitrogen hydrolase family protein [Bacillota bacterium]
MSIHSPHPALNHSTARPVSRRSVLKKTAVLGGLGVTSALPWPGLAGAGERAASSALPGRQVRVSAICIGFGGDHEKKLKLALEHLETAGQQGVHIACLPEEFAGMTAESIPGPTVDAVAAMARKYGMYVVCPIREQAGSEQYNTAVLLDRRGKVAGQYRKVFVFWGEGLLPSRDGVKAFDTDFGRISILTCFDLNFPELWQQADSLDVDIVFWPSAYTGGSPLNAMATLFHYYVVPVGAGNIIDATGRTLEKLEQPRPAQFIATLDLDRTFIHWDFTKEKVEKLLREHRGEVEPEKDSGSQAWYLLRSTKPGVRVRELCAQYKIETLRQYQHRSREQINAARAARETI